MFQSGTSSNMKYRTAIVVVCVYCFVCVVSLTVVITSIRNVLFGTLLLTFSTQHDTDNYMLPDFPSFKLE
jgi:hypothetical protein